MPDPDVVFIVKEKVGRPELQYALRSLVNVPHGPVWLIGGRPEWVVNVQHVPFPDGKDKWKNISDKFKSLAALDDLSGEFIYTEDDYFILKPVSDLPNFVHPQTLNERVEEYEKGSSRPLGGWKGYLQATRNALHKGGISEPESFDVHIPMLVEKNKIPLPMDTGAALSWRSMCGNTNGRDPVRVPIDAKTGSSTHLKKVRAAGLGFLSSTDGTFKKQVEPVLVPLFPDPCRYEKEYYMDSSPVFESSVDEPASAPASGPVCAECGEKRVVRRRRRPVRGPLQVVLMCGHVEEGT